MSDLDRRGDAPPPQRRPPWSRLPARYAGPIYAGWTAIWISAFALHQPEIGLPLMLGTGVLAAFVEPGRRRGRQRMRYYGRYGSRWNEPDGDAPSPVPAPIPAPVPAPAAPAPERALVAAVLRAETTASRFDPDALALIRELEGLLRPMLAQLRSRGGDPAVRHDVEAIASEHLPATLDAYLALPAHEPVGPDGSTPAEVLHSQLTLLVEGCSQLRDALRETDVRRQQELSRFLEAKFRRGDLDLD